MLKTTDNYAASVKGIANQNNGPTQEDLEKFDNDNDGEIIEQDLQKLKVSF